jgi:hypothetical protein
VFKNLDGIELAKDRSQYQALQNMVMAFQISEEADKFLSR